MKSILCASLLIVLMLSAYGRVTAPMGASCMTLTAWMPRHRHHTARSADNRSLNGLKRQLANCSHIWQTNNSP